MSKERLEEITSSVGILLSGDRHVLLRRKHYEWLIEQAERVADYEKRYEKHLDIDIRKNHKIQCLEYQIKRYREALEFYADEDNYREHDLKGIVPPRPIAYKPILHDYGSIARQAQ